MLCIIEHVTAQNSNTFGAMATLRSEDVLDSVNEGFPSDSSDSGSEESSVPVKKSSVGCLADCSDEKPPSFSSLSVTSSVKKQKMEADKRLKRANAVARDISASTPRRTTSKPVRPRCLSHSAKSASKPVPKTKCSIFDFTSTGQDPGNASVEGDTADRPDIMCALKDISTTLNDLVNRVASTEKEIRSVKSTITHISSPSSSSESVNVKEGVPNIIRVRMCLCTDISFIILALFSQKHVKYTKHLKMKMTIF